MLMTAFQGELRETTILFAALVGFSDFQASRPPHVLQETLEEFLQETSEACGQNQGEIDKIMGDKILVVFDHQTLGSAERAARAAWNTARTVRDALTARGFPLATAFGVNSGIVLAGVQGAPTVRLVYTVIGDPVNLAARLASVALDRPDGGIVVGGAIQRLLPPEVITVPLPIRRVKGKTQEVDLFLAS
jgi:adenylate cyclase